MLLNRFPRVKMSLAFSTIALATYPCIGASPSEDLAQVETRKIVFAREQVRGYVIDVKEKYKPSDKEYIEARKLYRKAQSEYASWVAVLSLAIRKGNTKNLMKDEGYLANARDAGEASRVFVEYGGTLTGETKGIFAFASAIVDIGLKIWNEVRERQAKERERYADDFQKEVKWERWEDIKANAQKS